MPDADLHDIKDSPMIPLCITVTLWKCWSIYVAILSCPHLPVNQIPWNARQLALKVNDTGDAQIVRRKERVPALSAVLCWQQWCSCWRASYADSRWWLLRTPPNFKLESEPSCPSLSQSWGMAHNLFRHFYANHEFGWEERTSRKNQGQISLDEQHVKCILLLRWKPIVHWGFWSILEMEAQD